jgi:hypothetical protein
MPQVSLLRRRTVGCTLGLVRYQLSGVLFLCRLVAIGGSPSQLAWAYDGWRPKEPHDYREQHAMAARRLHPPDTLPGISEIPFPDTRVIIPCSDTH